MDHESVGPGNELRRREGRDRLQDGGESRPADGHVVAGARDAAQAATVYADCPNLGRVTCAESEALPVRRPGDVVHAKVAQAELPQALPTDADDGGVPRLADDKREPRAVRRPRDGDGVARHLTSV